MKKTNNKQLRDGLRKLKINELIHWIYSRSRLLSFLPLICIFALSGCFAVTGTNLKSEDRVNSSLHRKAWIASVEIKDESVQNKKIVEDSLRGNILSYIQDSGYFTEVDTLPGNIVENDLFLDFQFDHFLQERSIHPAYFPAALLTLTVYIWVGGPVVIDESDLSGTLTVKDSHSQILTKVNSAVKEKRNLSLYTDKFKGSLEDRTILIRDLLKKAIVELREKNNNNK